MKLKINSQKLRKTLTFTRPGGYYIFVDLNGKEGTEGRQLCERGHLSGSTLGYSGEDQKAFNAICRAWYRRYLRTL